MAVYAQEHGDERILVLAVQQGDADAFDALFRRHYPAVRRACTRRLVDPVEADEVAQAAFVRAFERIDQCVGERRFGPWVHVIARSLCMDSFRARARVQPFGTPLGDHLDDRPHVTRTDEPEESILRLERAAHVHEALADLPERQRSAVIARDMEELRPGEIADRLGVSIGAVDSLLLRARRRLALTYRRRAGEGGGGASTRTLRVAAAASGTVLVAGPGALARSTAAAAATVQGTASKAASGVVGVVVSMALSLGAAGAGPGPAPEMPSDPPAAVTTVVRHVPAAAAAADRAGPATAPADSPVSTVPDAAAAVGASAMPGVTAPTPTATATPTPTTSTTLPAGPASSQVTVPVTAPPAGSPAATPPPAAASPPPTTTPAAAPDTTTTAPPLLSVDTKALGLPAIPPVTTPTLPSLGLGTSQP